MILHFLKRDFQDFQMGWVTIVVVTLLFALLSGQVFEESKLFFLFMVYVFFAIIPTNSVLGAVWRTQHQLSRHFLLSLPLPHKNLFLIQHLRLLVFWLPIISWSLILPFLSPELFSSFTVNRWVLYCLGLITSIGLMIQMNIGTALEQERVAQYLTPSERIFVQVRGFVINIGLILTLVQAWENLYLRAKFLDGVYQEQFLSAISHTWFGKLIELPLAEIIFPASFILLIFWAIHNRRRWCVTL